MTLILETLDNDACVPRNYTNFNLSFTTRGGLPGPGTVLQVFKTTSSAMFVRQPDIVIDGSSSFTVVSAFVIHINFSRFTGVRILNTLAHFTALRMHNSHMPAAARTIFALWGPNTRIF